MAARQLSNLASARNFYLFPIITIACRAENVHYCKMVSWDTLGISHFLFFVLKANKQKAKLKAGWGRSWLLAAGCCPHCTGRATPSCMAPPFTAIRPRPARRPPSPQQPHAVRLTAGRSPWLAAVTYSFSLSLRDRRERGGTVPCVLCLGQI